MKKIISSTLAVAISTTPVQTFADEVVNSDINENQPVTEEKASITGKLEVDINFAIPILNTSENDMKLTLKDGEGQVYKEVLLSNSIEEINSEVSYTIEMLDATKRPIVDGGEISFIRIIFDKLEIGEYSFDLSASGYKTASVDSIDITKYSKRVKIGTQENKVVKTYGETEEENTYETYPALFLAGDVDINEVIDMEDYSIILDNIDTNNPKYDLNKDGKTDIADLSYVKGSIGSENKTPEDRYYIEDTDAIIIPENVGITGPEGVEIKPEDLLSDNGNTVELPAASTITMDLVPTSVTRNGEEKVLMEQIIIKGKTEGDLPSGGTITLDGEKTISIGDGQVRQTRSGEAELVINLGNQVGVKEISIDVLGNRGNKNISEIAKIEFLNNVYKEIPKPVISIPTIKTLETSTNLHDERITISWEAQPNVTGYEVKYYKINENGVRVGAEKKLQTNKTNINILDKEIKPYDTFRVSIQSLNGEWSSGYAEDLANKSEEEGGLSDEKKAELIPYELDGKADNVDENFNLRDEYYGTGDYSGNPNMGSVSDIQVVPISSPEPPRNLKVTEGYKALTVSWENHIQAREFDVYYRKIGSSDERWVKANEAGILVNENDETVKNPDKTKLIRSHSYRIENLDDQSSYEIKVTATNHLGTSNMSETYLGTTKAIVPPITSNYRLINRAKENVAENEIPAINVVKVHNSTESGVTYDNEYAVIDNNYETNYTIQGWNGGWKAPVIEFDREYTVDRVNLVLNQAIDVPYIYDSKIVGYDESGKRIEAGNEYNKWASTDKNGKKYFEFKLDKPITVKKIQVVANVYPQNTNTISISEIKVYEADNIEQEVAALYEDEFRVKLNADVTQEKIDDLRKRVNTMDPVSFEYNPNRTYILNELNTAEKLLNEADLSNEIISLDPTITTNSNSVSLGMGNDWQSVGAVARPGKDENGNPEKLVVYMGRNNSSAKVQIAFLQTYGQPGEYISQVKELKVGRNEIEIPSIISEDVEKGGQVMVRVEGGNENTQVKVRIANATQIPHLNVNNIINDAQQETEVKNRIRAYIKELKKYVSNLPNMYPDTVTPQEKLNNIYTYEPTTSVLNNTDIEGDRFTLTMPATEILRGIEGGLNGNEDAEVERVYNALLAWEQQMQITFAKKGVYESADKAPSKEEYEANKAPQTRMNIKYQRMMMGAAGYASSHHVGVGFGGVADYMRGIPYKFDENQNVTNPDEARLYGALIAHEIGHVTDIGSRTYEETSNNLTVSLTSSMLNETPSNLGSVYKKLYEKVTSNTLGLSTDRNVVLGMLWQPYLAYEDDDTYKMLFTDNDTDADNDSYFAKLNRAYRTLTEEEKNNADRDQLLIRVTSKVAGKNLSNFYLAHGIVPNAETLAYVSKFPEETRPIQYINDEARRQRIAGTADMAEDTEIVASFGKDNEGKQILDKSYVNQNEVPINLSVTKDSDRILGYEIIRNGNPVGFVQANKDGSMTKYNDVIDNINNRVFTYEAVAYDYNLNATEKITLGTIKVRHDGSVDKSKLDITSNTIDKNDSNYDEHSHNPNPTLANIIDGDNSSIYEGKKYNTNEDPYIIIDANQVRSLAGIKYTAPTTTTKFFKKEKLSKSAIQEFEIQISSDGENWTKVKEGEFSLDSNNATQTIYFDKEGVEGGNQLNVYNTRFVKLIAKGATEISVAELDLIAPPGDNIEIGLSEDDITYKNGIGILKEEFVYQAETEDNEKKSIPKGSIIITGEYRGNPAFNVPLVLNENEEHIADKYKGILMAEVPDNGNLEEIAKGTWIYWVEPQYVSQFMQNNKEIFAELYRTDSADGQIGGQRLVSDTFKIDVPDELQEISLSSGKVRACSNENTKVIEIDTNKLKDIKNSR